MLTSFALIFILGILLANLFNYFKIPGLLGMLLAGMIIGPYGLNLIDSGILSVSADLRQFALVIILIRAGLSLDINSLKSVGRPAVLMCFMPAVFEIGAVAILAPFLFKIDLIDALIMGAVLSAVSPAVVVPRMIKLIEEKWGTEKSIPQLIMAGASVDDVFVIVLFTAFMSIARGGKANAFSFVSVPLSVLSGALLGWLLGAILSAFFRKIHMRDTIKVLTILSLSFFLLDFEKLLSGKVPFSALICIMAIGATIFKLYPVLSIRLSSKFSKLWVAAEVILFVLVGASVDIRYAISEGIKALILLLFALSIRMCGVFVCLLRTKLDRKERLFCMLAYTPKATVQAAIGSVPLSVGLSCGNLVLTVAVLSIIISAPLGAFAIDSLYKKLLKKEN